tara:strand:- start:3382 stop:4062 length:681 start_codon:yes stop_codon:yes gene_type:complete
MKRFMFFLFLTVTSVYAEESPMYQAMMHSEPEVQVPTEVYAGDLIVSQTTGEWRECIVPKQRLAKTHVGLPIVIKANKPICRKNAKSDYVLDYRTTETSQNEMGAEERVRLKEKKGKYQLSVCLLGRCPRGMRFNEIDKSDIVLFKKYLYRYKDSPSKSIEYSGKKGNLLKFIYSEYEGEVAQNAFTREFEIDLNEGNVGAYKGAVFEVLEATNMNIKYKVIRHFP